MERELIDDLKNQGYEYVPEITSPDALLTNARKQLQTLNQVVFTDAEWTRFVDEYLDKPSDSLVEKAKRCTRTISMTSYLTMGIFKIFIW